MLLNIVTAVSRPHNLPAILASIVRAQAAHGISVRWILILDEPGLLSPGIDRALQATSGIRIDRMVYSGGACKFGILQKNHGINQIHEGWYYLLDDDNIVHPHLFRGLAAAHVANPSKKAFAFNQHRWDSESKLARPERMQQAMIDNSMFVVHRDLIGSRRYDLTNAGIEDFLFFRGIYDAYPQEFVFLNTFMAFYNYLRRYPDALMPKWTDKVVVTMGDDAFRPLTDLTFPLAEDYAARIGADFHVIRERKYPAVSICYEKFQMADLLQRYRRILYVDGDVLVRTTALDVFQEVPFTRFGAMDEAAHLNHWTPEAIRQQFTPYGWTGPWNGRHFNAGVLVFDETHRRLFDNPKITNIPYWDQPYLNVAVERLGIPYFSLPPKWNHMIFHSYKKIPPQDSQFIHYSGTTRTPTEKAVFVRKDLQR